jgi:hypothetical protein
MRELPGEFRPVFQYQFANGRVLADKVLDQELWMQRGVVYARICDGQVVYVGKTDYTLRRRIMAHVRGFPKSPKSTDYRNHVAGKTVTIFAYKPAPIELFGLTISVHGCVESALIKHFKRDHGWFVKRGG